MRRAAVVRGAAVLLVVVFASVAAAACGRDGDGETDGHGGGTSAGDPTSDTRAVGPDPPVALPAGEDLYQPPDSLGDGPAGSLVWYDESPSIGEARAWRTLARSSDGEGRTTWVTARVFRPVGPAPEGGFPVAVWAHGTAGLADQCAPSRSGALVPGITNLLLAGFVVVAPDGAGLGTPGSAAYLVGVSEGRAVLDSARMATQVPGADAGDDVALWGYSSGGQAVLFAAQQAAAYAPDLTILGTAAVAPVSDMARFAGVAAAFPFTFGYAFMTFGAWSDVYDVDLTTIFAPGAMSELPLLGEACAQEIAPHFALTPIEQLRVTDATVTAPWVDLMAQNSVGASAASGPVLLIQGTDDPIIDPASTDALAQRLCGVGVDVELRSVPGARHEVVFPTAPDVVAWFADRSAGVSAVSTCSP